jgi:hypothetical protein
MVNSTLLCSFDRCVSHCTQLLQASSMLVYGELAALIAHVVFKQAANLRIMVHVVSTDLFIPLQYSQHQHA